MVDTATSSLDIRDENSNAEAALVIKSLQGIRECNETDATMFVLKHAHVNRETGKKTPRGAKQWVGAVDSSLTLSRLRGRPPKDGIAQTELEGTKSRAYGLKGSLIISPSGNFDMDGDGFSLKARQR